MKKHRKKGKAPKAPHKRLQELPPMTVSRADLNIAADPDPPAEELNSAAADVMAIDDILEQLASMKDNARSFLDPAEPDSEYQDVWQADIRACEAATDILSALRDEGISDPEEVRDVIHDYNALAKQYQEMHRKYETPAKPERQGGAFICPECHRQIRGSPKHCTNCGKRLGF